MVLALRCCEAATFELVIKGIFPRSSRRREALEEILVHRNTKLLSRLGKMCTSAFSVSEKRQA